MVAATTEAEEVLLTDGNLESVANIRAILTENQRNFRKENVTARRLVWSKKEDFKDLTNRFDHVICADCLFFTEVHDDLVFIIQSLLTAQGEATLFAPRRGGSLKLFLEKASENFEIVMKEEYDDWIFKKHLEESIKPNNQEYDKDIHYPLLIKMRLKIT